MRGGGSMSGGGSNPFALRDASGARGDGLARGAFLKRALVAGGAAVAAGGLATGAPRLAASAPQTTSEDTQILNAALALERVQVAFYEEAMTAGSLSGEAAVFARVVGGHEQEHVAFLERLLGGDADDAPTFDLGDSVSDGERFLRAALVLEDTATGLYVGQGGNLSVPLVAQFASLVSVEARQAAWVRDIVGENPAPAAADPAKTGDDVRAELAQVGIQLSE
jgi:hypothetical protein